MLELPVINLETLRRETLAERRIVAGALGAACRETGFFWVSGHGVSSASRTSLFAAARKFFELPIGRKNGRSIARPHERPRYAPVSVRDYLLSRLTATYDHHGKVATG